MELDLIRFYGRKDSYLFASRTETAAAAFLNPIFHSWIISEFEIEEIDGDCWRVFKPSLIHLNPRVISTERCCDKAMLTISRLSSIKEKARAKDMLQICRWIQEGLC